MTLREWGVRANEWCLPVREWCVKESGGCLQVSEWVREGEGLVHVEVSVVRE